ncbi:MAG: isoprenoid biosynthesis glyoxalase ElbB [Bacteriovoracaceae bacterium]|nr:isoprenoid biosynthesis glyoxalase ElbB [Bacteriovoracaceae bacterium]
MSKKIAVILSGCGYLDGSEIREAVLTLTALDTLEAKVSIFAPNQDQFHVVNHILGTENQENRNIIEESARIARGDVTNLTELSAQDFDGIIFPGGFGVAKNLCNWAFEGSNCQVDSNIEKLIKNFYELKKPIAAICIAPALIATVLGSQKITVTIGNDQITADEIIKTGAFHENKEVHEICIDKKHKIISTPAYMYGDAKLHKIQEGIFSCVKAMLELT